MFNYRNCFWLFLGLVTLIAVGCGGSGSDVAPVANLTGTLNISSSADFSASGVPANSVRAPAGSILAATSAAWEARVYLNGVYQKTFSPVEINGTTLTASGALEASPGAPEVALEFWLKSAAKYKAKLYLPPAETISQGAATLLTTKIITPTDTLIASIVDAQKVASPTLKFSEFIKNNPNLEALVAGFVASFTDGGYTFTDTLEKGIADAVASSTTPVVQVVAAPIFSPTAGTFTSAQAVTITTTTTGANIYYTLDSSTLTASSTVHTGPISLNTTTTIRAFATKTGKTDSLVTTGLYTLNIVVTQVPTPTFSPAAGAVNPGQTVTINATTGASFYYTTDGSNPTTASTKYVDGTPITVNVTTTIRVFATKAGLADSAVATATYTISTTVAAPTFSPVAGTYSPQVDVTATSMTTGSSIFYTTDGTTPTAASSKYMDGTPITVKATTTLKAFATKAGLTDSTVTTAVYTIKVPPTTITFVNSMKDVIFDHTAHSTRGATKVCADCHGTPPPAFVMDASGNFASMSVMYPTSGAPNKYCGECHNGTTILGGITVFSTSGSCSKCH